MITDNDLKYIHDHEKLGHALSWVIDGECVYDIALNDKYAEIFLLSDTIEDVSLEYPDLPGITVRFFKNGLPIEELNTSEYFGSVLLTPHLVINLHGHTNGWYVSGANAQFVDKQFVILDRTPEEIDPDIGKIDGLFRRVCTEDNCHCYKEI